MFFTDCQIEIGALPILRSKWIADVKHTRASEFDQRRLYITITLDAAILWHMRRIVRRVLLAVTIDGLILTMSGAATGYNLCVAYYSFMRIADPMFYPRVGFVKVGIGLSAALALVWIMRSWREEWRERFLQIGARYG